ncbi:7967_t:CDS:2, partial [Paraglomus occultum]
KNSIVWKVTRGPRIVEYRTGILENITESNDLKYRSKMTRISHDVADDNHKLVEYLGEPPKPLKNRRKAPKTSIHMGEWRLWTGMSSDVVVEKQKRNMT